MRMNCAYPQKRKAHPKEKANICSLITFFYTLKIFIKGYRRDLQENDLYKVLNGCESRKLGDKIEREWKRLESKTVNRSVYRLLWNCFGKKYLLLVITQLIFKTSLTLMQPVVLGKMISCFTGDNSNASKLNLYTYAIIVILLNVVDCVYEHQYKMIITEMTVQVRTALCTLIYRKILKLGPDTISENLCGNVVTLITKDVHSFARFMVIASDVWVAFLKITIIFILIYRAIGIGALSGLAFLLAMLPLQFICGWTITKWRTQTCIRTDLRMQATHYTLSFIRLIKMHAWEDFFVRRISKYRHDELRQIYKSSCMKSLLFVFGKLSSSVSFYLIIVSHVWFGNQMTTETVYFIVGSFQTLTVITKAILPLGIFYFSHVHAAVRRIEAVLCSQESNISPFTSQPLSKPEIIMRSVTVESRGQKILENFSANFMTGLNIIYGGTGKGKTILVKTLLKEIVPLTGYIKVYGRISYASQEPWIFPSTIRQNILFGQPLNLVRYEHVLKVCALNYDLNLLDDCDKTILSDRGCNLSSGQRARINLARAVYKEADIYLLDDCLCTLDAPVKSYIFQQCIKNFLYGKLVVFVTNDKHLHEVADKFVIMQDGVSLNSDIVSKSVPCESLSQLSKETSDDDFQNEIETRDNEKVPLTYDIHEPKVFEEVCCQGKVEWATYKSYLHCGGGIKMLLVVIILFAIEQSLSSYTDKLLSIWVNTGYGTVYKLNTNTTSNETINEDIAKRRSITLSLYGKCFTMSLFVSLICGVAIYTATIKASRNLHKHLNRRMFGATMHFFDNNFVGNIMNRFSKDLNTIDEGIPIVLNQVLRTFFPLAGIFILILSVNAYFLIPTIVFITILVVARFGFLPTGRSLRRLDGSTRSPVAGHLISTLNGLTTIRAFRNQRILRDEFDLHQDLNTSAYYTYECCLRSFSFFADCLSAMFSAVLIIYFVCFAKDALAGNVGLALTQAFMVTKILNYGIPQWAELESQMTSVERVLEYSSAKQEAQTGSDFKLWPTSGHLQFKNVSLRYSNNRYKVLSNLTFEARPKQKIAIVGRTGAGKSSIIAAIFRLYNVDGAILVDGIDINSANLNSLRSSVSIIAQIPFLFEGTIRENIDPLGRHSDTDILKALRQVQLHNQIQDLSMTISTQRSELSILQQHLIAIARAIVRQSKIVVLDELTSSVDKETEEYLTEMIFKCFINSTLIIISHKLHIVLYCDIVIVLNNGKILEIGSPQEICDLKGGRFRDMMVEYNILSNSTS